MDFKIYGYQYINVTVICSLVMHRTVVAYAVFTLHQGDSTLLSGVYNV